LRQPSETHRFSGFTRAPQLSINRGFSAPIELREEVLDADLLFRLANDGDSFNRWDAGQKLALGFLVTAVRHGKPATGLAAYAKGLSLLLNDSRFDDAFKALMLQLPSEAEVTSALTSDVDADTVHAARDDLRRALGQALKPDLLAVLARSGEKTPYAPDTAGTARRSVRYAALSLLAMADSKAALEIAMADIAAAHSMTAEVGALSALISAALPESEPALASFHARHRHEHLLVDKWFAMQGMRAVPHAARHVEALTNHADFRFTTPNRVYALVGSFSGGNLAGFHAADGEGYRFLADTVIRLDAINPQVAARMATAFRTWRLYDAPRRGHATAQLRRIIESKPLSRDVFEIISRTLGATA
jgi:aminopeptidase N